MVQSTLIFLFQIVAHAALIYLAFHLSWLNFLITILFYFLFTAIGSDATFHRLLAHKSFKAPRWFFLLGNVLGTLGGVGSSIAWVANHRAHHRFVDTAQDPHSPHHKGFLRVQFFSMFETVNIKYAIRLLKDDTLVFFHKYYWAIHLTYFLALLAFYPDGIVTMYLAPAALNWTMSAFINNICHLFGYRVQETQDKSTNNFIIGILSFGEGWHNYHHAFPNDYRCGHGRSEPDLVAWIIEMVRVDEFEAAKKPKVPSFQSEM